MIPLRRDESGEGLISGLILLAGVMLPLMFLIAIFGHLEVARLTAQQAARRRAQRRPGADAGAGTG